VPELHCPGRGRGVHGRVLRCTGTAPDALRFELPLATYTSGDVRA
jgi:hypothetical protein